MKKLELHEIASLAVLVIMLAIVAFKPSGEHSIWKYMVILSSLSMLNPRKVQWTKEQTKDFLIIIGVGTLGCISVIFGILFIVLKYK